MRDAIIKILTNPGVVAALTAVAIAALTRLADWIKSKTPAGIVEAWWPYLHKAIGTGIDWIGRQAESGKLTRGDADKAIALAMEAFKAEMRLHEPKQAMTANIEAAARAEIVAAYDRYMTEAVQ